MKEIPLGIHALVAASMATLSSAHLHEIALCVGYVSAIVTAVCAVIVRTKKSRSIRGRKPRAISPEKTNQTKP